MVFVPDAVDDIASVVRALAATAEVVITAGGIGPTLDDVTMQVREQGRQRAAQGSVCVQFLLQQSVGARRRSNNAGLHLRADCAGLHVR